jgi:alcohol dehydrogenase (cytochrome c)
VWTPLSLDVETESLYVAVTNPAPDFPADLRPGDNLYTNSVLSLDVLSGELNWYRQLLPADDHGWDLTQVSPLYEAVIQGEQRALVTSVGKDGVMRVLDRITSEPMFQAEVTLQQNTEAPVTTTGTYSCPGVLGGVLWNGSALDKNSTVLVTPSVNLCSTFYRALETRYIEGEDYFGGTVVSDPATLSGWITAVDGVNGQLRWKYESELPVVAAVTTTAGGLVLAGEMNGDFIVLDSASGKRLYRFNTGGAIGGGIISYAVEGKQYIAVASGRPSPTQVNGESGSPTLVIFSLPEERD